MKKIFSYSGSQIVSYNEVKKILELLDTLKKEGTLSKCVTASFELTEDCNHGEIDCTLTTNDYEEFMKIHSIFFESNM